MKHGPMKDGAILRPDIVRLTLSDLTQRARVARGWGVPGSSDLVARTAIKWVEHFLKEQQNGSSDSERDYELIERELRAFLAGPKT